MTTLIAYNMKLSVYHVLVISTAVSISLVWVYWKVNKLERHLKDINNRLTTNTANLNNLCTSLELEREEPSVVKDKTSVVFNDHVSDRDVDEIMAELSDVEESCSAPSFVEASKSNDGTGTGTGTDTCTENICTDDTCVDDNYEKNNEVAMTDPESDDSYKAILSSENWVFTEDELKKKTVEDLKQFLASKQQSVKGVKKDLIQRIIDLVK